jgi:hypothetical protein
VVPLLCCRVADYTPVLLDDRRFMVFTARLNYKDAYAVCVTKGALLATLRSQDETSKLLTKTPTSAMGPNPFGLWTGLTNTPPPNAGASWEFTTGTTNPAEWRWMSTLLPPLWDNWARAASDSARLEPNNNGFGEGQCAGVWIIPVSGDYAAGSWNDL